MAVKQLKIVGLLLAKSSDFKWSWFYIIEPFACFCCREEVVLSQ